MCILYFCIELYVKWIYNRLLYWLSLEIDLDVFIILGKFKVVFMMFKKKLCFKFGVWNYFCKGLLFINVYRW